MLSGAVDDAGQELRFGWSSAIYKPPYHSIPRDLDAELWRITHCLENTGHKPLVAFWEKAGMMISANSPLPLGRANQVDRTATLDRPITDFESPIRAGYRGIAADASTYQGRATTPDPAIKFGARFNSVVDVSYFPDNPADPVVTTSAYVNSQITRNGYQFGFGVRSSSELKTRPVGGVILGISLQEQTRRVLDTLASKAIRADNSTLGAYIRPSSDPTDEFSQMLLANKWWLELLRQQFIFVSMGAVDDYSVDVLEDRRLKLDDGVVVLLRSNRTIIGTGAISILQPFQ